MPLLTTFSVAQKHRRCLIYIAIGIILQTLIIIAFVLIFMRIRTPNLRFLFVSIEKITASPSFTIKLNGEVAVKNSNFGHFRFPDGTVTFLYQGSAIGSAQIPGGRANARSTKRLNVTVAVESKDDPSLNGDLSSGKLTLSSRATLEGKVHLFKAIKRKKTATIDCTMDVDTKTRVLENLKCK